MYYLNLANEYLKESHIIRDYINRLKSSAKKKNQLQNIEMDYRIRILYSIYLDLKHDSEYLFKKCEVMKNANKISIAG